MNVLLKITGIAISVTMLLGCDLAPAGGYPTETFPRPTPSATEERIPSSVIESAKTKPVDISAAIKKLNSLRVAGRAPMTGYLRTAKYGSAWLDVDRNGCDTRNDILKRDLSREVFKDSKKCVILSGELKEPYLGKPVHFVRGVKTSIKVQIDHVVALGDSWQKGAQKWSQEKRIQFANDPINLLAVDGPSNGAKGLGDAATWLPKNKSYRCTYVTKQVNIKAKYALWVTSAEKTTISNILKNC